MIYHGLKQINSERYYGELHFGFIRFLEALEVEIRFKPATKEKSIFIWPEKWVDNFFYEAISKFKETVFKIDRVSNKLFVNFNNFLNNSNFSNSNEHLLFNSAMQDIPIFLDSLLSYLRIQADCIANVIPYLYGLRGKSNNIAKNSFRDQLKWFIKKNPSFDPRYTCILNNYTEWFEDLTGKAKNKGLRDKIFHYRGTYLLGSRTYSNKRKIINISLKNESGFIQDDLIPTIVDLISKYFLFLDNSLDHFFYIVENSIKGEFFKDIPSISRLIVFQEEPGSSWIYPKF